MPRPAKPRACPHTDRPIYAHGLCKSCYDVAHRKKSTKLKCDRKYEERNRTERNEQRRILAAKRRASSADSRSHELDGD